MPQLLIIPVVIIAIIGTIFFIKKKNKREDNQLSLDEKTANDFTNVIDIQNNIIFTKTHLMSIIQISPISVDLLSSKEEEILMKNLTEGFSNFKEKFKFLAISRPISIAPLIDDLNNKLDFANSFQRTILKQEISQMTEYAISGEVVERQFFIVLDEKGHDEKKIKEKIQRFTDALIDKPLNLNTLDNRELIKFINLLNNPSVVHLEDSDFEVTSPRISLH